jgi:hypothetical protein
MKTPREILLERHQVAQPKLDRLRQQVLSSALEARAASPHLHVLARAALKMWRELIWPSRRTWAGLTAAWVVLAAINLEMGDTVRMSAGERLLPASDLAQAFAEQKRVLAELLQPAIALPPKPPRPSPRPHSERPMGTRVGRLDFPGQIVPNVETLGYYRMSLRDTNLGRFRAGSRTTTGYLLTSLWVVAIG